jgi:hypothetical protein
VANEPIVGDGKEKNFLDLFKPAIIAVIALIAVLIIIFYFRIAVIVIMSPFRDILLSWTTSYDSNPFLNVLYDLPYGLMLFLLAGLLSPVKILTRRCPIDDGLGSIAGKRIILSTA